MNYVQLLLVLGLVVGAINPASATDSALVPLENLEANVEASDYLVSVTLRCSALLSALGKTAARAGMEQAAEDYSWNGKAFLRIATINGQKALPHVDPEEVTAQQLKRLVPDHLHYLELMNKRLDDQQTIFGGGGLLDRDMGFCQSTMDEFKQRALADGNKAGAGVFR